MVPTHAQTLPLPKKVEELRAHHPVFTYHSFGVVPEPKGLRLTYHFSISKLHSFKPEILIPVDDPHNVAVLSLDPSVQRLAFLIGLVELISYWKLCCSPLIQIDAGTLSADEIPFWEGLIRKGLGEFFYMNQIPPSLEFAISSAPSNRAKPPPATYRPSLKTGSCLVLVGGGKDSIVTLELLRQSQKVTGYQLGSLAINPIPASLDAIQAAHYPPPLIAKRALDPQLLALNSQGYLNGHTPFSALLAFVATLTAYVNGYRFVLASNEASASEGNTEFHGFDINHQYSKSLEFEQLFRDYVSKLDLTTEYLSFLRPLNELQICALFSGMTQYHSIFRSCNREQTLSARARSITNTTSENSPRRVGWCADCPKCIFTYICLRCFLSQQELVEIFGTDPSSQPHFSGLASALAGFGEHKPFECVGTYQEVRSCLARMYKHQHPEFASNATLQELREQVLLSHPPLLSDILQSWNPSHFLSDSLEPLLRTSLATVHRRVQ